MGHQHLVEGVHVVVLAHHRDRELEQVEELADRVVYLLDGKIHFEASVDGLMDATGEATLERAIVKLLSTPVLRDPVRVEPKGIGYGFEDPRIEALTPAQKHLLRFGPGNGQMVRHALRSIAAALGIPKERLPN